ncbi:hypothetical protein SESBI_11956 [Sesbania bispinosa]|nr:hypothetical protein SESBI_11956 [Sesbania bispinosa]
MSFFFLEIVLENLYNFVQEAKSPMNCQGRLAQIVKDKEKNLRLPMDVSSNPLKSSKILLGGHPS